MFDLFRSRDKAVRILLGALLLMVAISMLTYLVPNYNSGAGGGSSDTVVAQVGNETVTQTDVQRSIQNVMRGRQIPAEILPNYIPQMVQELITERAVAYEAQRLGFQVTDKELADFIKQTIPTLYQGGKFVGTAAYAAILGQQNLTMEEFEADMRRQLLQIRLHEIAVEGAIVSPADIEKAYRDKNDQLKIQFVKLTSDKYKKEVEPTLEEMQNYFKTNAARYVLPESKNLTVLVADQAKLEQTLNPTDADLQRLYTQNMDSFRVPEEVKVRHILLMTQGKPAAEDAPAKAKAQDILKQVRAGANFADLAKKYSEDPGSKDKGGEYTITHDTPFVAEFKDAAFRMKPGESDVVKSSFGYHVMQVMEHTPPRVKPLAEAKDQLVAEWRKQQAADFTQKISDQVQQAWQKDPTHPEAVAAQFHMDVVKADNVQPGKPVAGIGSNPDFDQAIASLKVGEVSQPVAIAGNKIAVAQLSAVVPSRPNTFDEVKEDIKNTMMERRLDAKVAQHAQELLDKAKSMGGNLEQAAKAMGLEVKTTGTFQHTGMVDGFGSASYVQDGFGKPDGSLLGPIAMPDGTVVVKVLEHVSADMSKLPAQRAELRDQIKRQRAADRVQLFDAGVRDALIKDGKIKVHQDVVTRLINNYKSS
jgi:peptidyl-prolyl cis-trans isomerase D